MAKVTQLPKPAAKKAKKGEPPPPPPLPPNVKQFSLTFAERELARSITKRKKLLARKERTLLDELSGRVGLEGKGATGIAISPDGALAFFQFPAETKKADAPAKA